MKRNVFPSSWILLAAAVSLVMACGLATRPEPALRPEPDPAPPKVRVDAPSDERPRAALIEALDRLIQVRFEIVEGGKFGASRLARPVVDPPHRMAFRPKNR